jgi:hypothetical protein
MNRTPSKIFRHDRTNLAFEEFAIKAKQFWKGGEGDGARETRNRGPACRIQARFDAERFIVPAFRFAIRRDCP